MVASEVAFRSDTPLAGLVLLSGTVVDEASWRAGYGRRRGLPVFVAHGRKDGVLPFAASDRMRQELQAAGLDVTWHPFDGSHDVPARVVTELNRFLRDRVLRVGATRASVLVERGPAAQSDRKLVHGSTRVARRAGT
jgi:phospholipase/carboxylesterase